MDSIKRMVWNDRAAELIEHHKGDVPAAVKGIEELLLKHGMSATDAAAYAKGFVAEVVPDRRI
ncbi:hypothetical protein QZN20_23820 [Burkholderia multivorans]|nr:hypothetical protein [Burkholderia multivorans]